MRKIKICNHFFFIIIFFVPVQTLFAQYYPVDYFQSPMDTPLYLSAPFGSLRNNHFHSGMDIRTYEREGLPVYAVADGYVARIKIQSGGYGKAIYIDHPNGYTSVYAHLQKYEGMIATYIKKYQYENESYEFDHFPGRGRIKVTKGEIIGWSGNSGTSTGPHLHFEIRDTKSEEPVNPQLFGIATRDSFPPVIKKLIVYALNNQSPQFISQVDLNKKKLTYTDSGYVFSDTILLPQIPVGFAVEASDFLMNNQKEYSVYGLSYSVDNKKYFSFQLDRFHFNDTRCINVHIDYTRYKNEGIRYQKLFLDDGNVIPLYPYRRNNGKYTINDTLTHLLKLTAYDFSGQSFNCYVYLKADPYRIVLPNTPSCVTQWMYPKKSNVYKTAQFTVQIPAGSLYDTLALCVEQLPKEKNTLSPTYKINEPTIPLHKNISVSIKADETIKPEWQKKLLLAYTVKGNTSSAGGTFENGFVTAQTNQFGNFFITIDTISPVIKLLNADRNNAIKDTISLKLKITDNFSGIGTYRATINGQWILTEYDAKNDQLEYFFDENTPKGKLEFELIVTDRKENSTIYKTQLTRP